MRAVDKLIERNRQSKYNPDMGSHSEENPFH